MLAQEKFNVWRCNNSSKWLIGLYIPYSATANQMITFAQELNAYSNIACIGISLVSELNSNTKWYDDVSSKIPFVFFHKKECEQLTKLDAIIIPESNKTVFEFIPSSIIKIGLPHGTDVSLEATLCGYGGGFYFDYILSARKQSRVKLDKYFDSFPAAMRLHKQPFVCVVPFGFPKLDKFFKVVTKNKKPKNAIVYHLSLLSVEEDWVCDELFDTLKVLLTEFPNNTIIFRVHHRNSDVSIVTRCINTFSSYPNFYYSDADSYIDDYSNGAVMVTHREYCNHLFDLATGCPTVLYNKNDNYIMRYPHDERYFLTNKANFVQVVKQALDTNFDISIERRKQRCLLAGIYNPGNSLGYLINNIKQIVNGHVQDEWTLYNLSEGSFDKINFKLRQNIISSKPFGPFALAYSAMMNFSAYSLLLLSENHIRNITIKEHYYPLGLKSFYQLVHHDDFHLVSVEAGCWWLEKGQAALNFCLEAIDNGGIVPTPEFLWLKEHYVISEVNEDKSNNFAVDEFNIINLQDGSNIKFNDIILYGAGVFSERIIEWNKRVKMFNPVAIIDGDESKQNTVFCGLTIYPPTYLNKYSEDIIICSQGSLLDIVNSLILGGVKNKLFGFIDEPINLFLLDLIAKTREVLPAQKNLETNNKIIPGIT